MSAPAESIKQRDQPTGDAVPRGKNRAMASRRTFEILFAFTVAEPRLTAPEIAQRTGIPLPTTYRLVAQLREMGLLGTDASGRLYISQAFIALGRTAEAADTVAETAHPLMADLAAMTNETVLLVRMVAGSAMCVRRIETAHPLRISFEPGKPLALAYGASGKLLLASLPQTEIASRLQEIAQSDPRHAESLSRELPVIAEQGWAVSEAEIDDGMWAVSAAISLRGHVVAALTIPIPLIRVTAQARDDLRRSVCATAAAIGDRLDGSDL